MKTNQKTQVKKQRTTNGKTKTTQLNLFYQPHQLKNERLIEGIWNAAHGALWPHQDFSSKEKEEFKNLIVLHLFKRKSTTQAFIELVERICLAKRYVSRKRGRYISKPQDWLNIYYPLGLAGTEGWLERVKEVRADVPDYNKGIKIFANGILKYTETPSQQVFHKYRRQLMNEKQFDLLQIFNNTIINLQYNN
ncbi:MAG: hypothetical protein HY062_01765 [Bacteroidetes bacterium]|nr:hypothetical protein [Bacteroidota bacterium]